MGLGKEKADKAERLWFAGLMDSQIAKEIGCHASNVYKWRKKNHLPSNKGLFDWKKKEEEDCATCTIFKVMKDKFSILDNTHPCKACRK